MDIVYKTLGLPAELLSKVPGIGPIVKACCTSVGQKILMAITGLSLVGFLVVHLGGNFNLFAGEAAFNGYAEKLHSLGPLLAIAETKLFAIFALHLGLALSTRAMSARARKSGYEKTESKQSGFLIPNGGAANMMFITGLILGGYVVLHVLDMKINIWKFDAGESKYALVRMVLRDPLHWGVYLVALIALGIHLSHGISSAFQTLGISHPRWNKILRFLSVALAWLIAGGFMSLLVWAYAFEAR
ncbi:MAG: succinate dehydrogenase cytochrome b subunit [Planctomycetaceae bacterium]|nr:succinate dehydrogenase cytochrome b subunit [Planctomycetaceae bacterium]